MSHQLSAPVASHPSALGSPGGELAFRISGGDRDGQLIRVERAKCSIGSDPQCTLRLQAAGVEPVHCYILRGEAGTVVRRWSAETRLNGRPFRDAPLQLGDRLTLGPLELEMVPPAPAAEADEEEPDEEDGHGSSAASEEHAVDEQLAELHRGRDQLRREREDFARQRAADLRELEELRAQLDYQTAVHEQRRRELQIQAEMLDDERRRPSQQSAEEHQDLDRRRRELLHRAKSLCQQQSDFEKVKAQWEREKAEARRDLEGHREELERQRADLREAQRQLMPTHSGPPDGQTSEHDASAPPTEAAADDVAAAEKTQTTADDEPSVEEYMTKLMQRLQGSQAQQVKGSQAKEGKRSQARQTKAQASSSSPPPSSAQPDGRREGTPRAPRTAAPEKAANLQAMREVANASARSAIDTSAKRTSLSKVRSRFLISLASAIVGGVLIVLSDGLGSWFTAAAAASLAVAAVSGIGGWRLRRRMHAESAARKKAGDS